MAWSASTMTSPGGSMSRLDIADLGGVWSGDFIRRQPPVIDWLVHDLFVRGGTTEIYAPTGMGKSWMAYQIAGHIIGGEPLFDRFAIERPGNVVLVQAELDESQLRFRLHSQAQSLPGLNDPGVVLINDQGQEHRITRPHIWQRIVELIDRTQAEMLILDPLRQMTPNGDMNDERGITWLLEDHLDELRFSRKVHILIIHHTRKAKFTDTGDRIRTGYEDSGGSRAVIEWAEAIMRIEGDAIDKPDGRQQLVIEKLRGAPRTHDHNIQLKFDHQRLLFVPEGHGTFQRDNTLLQLLDDGPLPATVFRNAIEKLTGLKRTQVYKMIHDLVGTGAIIQSGDLITRGEVA